MKKIWQKIIFYCLLTLCIVVCSSVKKTKLFWTLHFENFLDTRVNKKNQPHRASINCERSFSRTLVKALLFTVCFVCVQAESLVNLYWTGLSD